MSKLLPFLVAGVGASSVSVGGVFMLKKTGGSAVDNTQQEPNQTGSEQSSKEQNLVFDDVNKFKEVDDVSKYDCLKEDFTGLKLKDSLSKIASQTTFSPATDAFFKADANAQTTPYQSCLLINGKKTTYGADTNAKGHGEFTWLGTFVKGDEGFINFNVAETQGTTDKKLKFSGVFYLVGKEGGNWEIKHKKEVTENKTSDASGNNSMFPKKANALDNETKPYWDFLDTNGTLDNVCQEGSCGDSGSKQPAETRKFIWKGRLDTSVQTKLKDWSDNTTWGKTLFGSEWDLNDKLKDLKGSGTKVNS